MQLTDKAKTYLLQATDFGTKKVVHLFRTETCCGFGVGASIKSKKQQASYVIVEDIPFQFDPDMLLALHGMIIDTININGTTTLQIKLSN